MADHDAPPAEPIPSDAGPDDDDPIAGIQPLRRVESVQAVMRPMHREHEEPKPSEPRRIGPQLRLVPFRPEPRRSSMATMSDLGAQGDRGGYPHGVAKVARRPPPPAEPEG